MRARTVERLLWGASLTLIASTLLAWREGRPHPIAAPAVIWPIERSAAYPTPRALDSATKAIVASDPFRLERRPSSVAYGSQPEGAPVAPPQPKPPKPGLALAGVVGGPPWVALLDGVPGKSGSVLVHAGDTLAGLRVRSLGPNGITITGFDTTWKLTLKKPWH
jgi:hypothetical protein